MVGTTAALPVADDCESLARTTTDRVRLGGTTTSPCLARCNYHPKKFNMAPMEEQNLPRVDKVEPIVTVEKK